MFLGKDGHPTIAFEAVVSHNRKFLSVSDAFYGTINDKTISRHDKAFTVLRDPLSFLSKQEFHTLHHNGKLIKHKGVYYICDGGYHRWPCYMNLFKHQVPGMEQEKWSQHIESIRKDVECSFGILKKSSFLILKHPMRFHNIDTIQGLFTTCCVIHNMLLEHDGLDESGKLQSYNAYTFTFIYLTHILLYRLNSR